MLSAAASCKLLHCTNSEEVKRQTLLAASLRRSATPIREKAYLKIAAARRGNLSTQEENVCLSAFNGDSEELVTSGEVTNSY